MITALALLFALQAAPELTASSPADGDVAVAPGERTLSFTFDRPMLRDRWSVTDGDQGARPAILGQPAFSPDGRTFTVRMRVEPGRTYVVSANGPGYTNFQGEDGVPADPALIRFTTAPER